MLLLETPEAVTCLDEILEIPKIDEIHIGINDLSLGYKKQVMFELFSRWDSGTAVPENEVGWYSLWIWGNCGDWDRDTSSAGHFKRALSPWLFHGDFVPLFLQCEGGF